MLILHVFIFLQDISLHILTVAHGDKRFNVYDQPIGTLDFSQLYIQSAHDFLANAK